MANGTAITNANIPSIITFKKTNAGGENVPFTGTIDAQKKVITINPNPDLLNEQVYYLALNNNVIRFQGADLIPGQSVIFTTIHPVQLVIYDNFDDAGTLTWGYWDNNAGGILDVEAPNPFPNPFGLNPTPIVAEFTKDSGSDPYTHAFAILGGKLDLTVNNQFQMYIYCSTAGSIFAVKLQNNELAEPWTTEVTAQHTGQSANVWELASFDFSTHFNRTDLDKILVMVNPGQAGSGIYFFDELIGPPFTPPAASPVVLSAYTSFDGSAIEVKFDKDMEPEPGNNGNFNVYVNGFMNPLISTYRKTDDHTIIVLNHSAPIQPDDVILLTYLMSGTVTSLDNGVLQAFNDYPVINTLALQLDLTFYLEGPFNGAEMTTSLNPSNLPLNQPYSGAPWNYTGNESVAAIPSPDIVDWVLIEIRDATNASLATSATVIARQAAFLLKNGKVSGLDGSINPLLFEVTPQYGLFVFVWHRNHIGILSASEVVAINNIYTYNFGSGANLAFGSTQNEIGVNLWGMIAGNGLADIQIDESDKALVWETQAGESGYLQGDFNLDTQVDNIDKDDFWYPNIGAGGSDYQLIWHDEFDVDGAPAEDN